jgi:hypothetical protein
VKLFVCLDGDIAGTIETSGSRVRFTYSEPWLDEASSYPVSLAWPLQPTIPHCKTYALFNQPPVKPARSNPRTRVGALRIAFQMIPVL